MIYGKIIVLYSQQYEYIPGLFFQIKIFKSRQNISILNNYIH